MKLKLLDINSFIEKLGPQERRTFEQNYKESNPSPTEVSSCIVKIINETRLLFVSGTLKYDKIDPELVIPDEFESKLEKSAKESGSSGLKLVSDSTQDLQSANGASSSTGVQLGNPNEIDSLRRKIVELNQMINVLKKDNTVMREKLEKIKKIA